MRRIFALSALTIATVGRLTLAAEPLPLAPPPTPVAAPMCSSLLIPRANAFQLGLMLQLLLPNRLQDFQTSLPAYGPVVGVPLGQDLLHFGGYYGSSSGLSLFIVETGYQLNLSTPFFEGFLLAGVHYLHYSLNSKSHEYWGPNGGLGLSLGMSRNSTLDLAMKVYFQDRAIVTFGGGFNFLL